MSQPVSQPVPQPVPLVRIDGLHVGFAGRPSRGSKGAAVTAVDDVSLELRDGEVLALVGESGSGKSVTARAIVGLLPGTARVTGSVRLGDQELIGLPEDKLRQVRGARVAMVFQEPSTALNPVETIGWQIGEALHAHQKKITRGQVRQRVIELLTLVGIPDPETRRGYYPHQFSGGQKQRIVIAIALANDPEVLIADEPTTALDVTVQAEILELLRTLRERTRAAVLLITHNMGVVADLADRVAVMRHGRIVEVGAVRDVFSAPTVAYTRQLLAAVPRLDADTAIDIAVVEPTPVQPVVTAGPAPVFAVNALAVDYPGRAGRSIYRALADITVSVAPGEVLGIVGESGSGKSTLGRVAVGLLRPAEGTALLFDRSLVGLTRSELRSLRRRIGVVYQDPAASLDPVRTIGDSIAEPMAVHTVGTREDRQRRVRELLEAVELPASYADRLPRQLSGGQRQRVAVARALVLDPDLVVADEPTSALDVSVQASVLALFQSLQERLGFACLFISHDLAVVNQVSDRVAVLRGGRLVEQGSVGTVLHRPSTDYTRRLLAAIPVPDPVAQASRRAAAAASR